MQLKLKGLQMSSYSMGTLVHQVHFLSMSCYWMQLPFLSQSIEYLTLNDHHILKTSKYHIIQVEYFISDCRLTSGSQSLQERRHNLQLSGYSPMETAPHLGSRNRWPKIKLYSAGDPEQYVTISCCGPSQTEV